MYKDKYDLIVAGGGPGGIPAAIAAARMGLNTLLVERSSQLGGLMVAGLPILAFIDRAGNKVVGGIAQEFIDRLADVGATPGHLTPPLLNSATPVNPAWARIIAAEMCGEAGVDVLLYAELDDVKIDNGRVKGVSVYCRGKLLKFETEILIDATGDACGAYLSGAKYLKGDEKNHEMQPTSMIFGLADVDFDAFFAYLKAHPEAYRLPDSFYGMQQTMDYFLSNPQGFHFIGFQNIIDKARANGEYDIPRNVIDFFTQKDIGGKGYVMVNVTRAVGVDTTNLESVIHGEFECLSQIKRLVIFMQKYIPGFKDCTLISIEPCLGARESRRIAGKKTLTKAALEHCDIPDDTVALAGYNVDSHMPGTDQISIMPVEHAIGIPYGCLLPAEIDGLLMSGRTISVDHYIFAMTRVMGTCMAIGEACGVAAAIAHKNGIAPAQVDVSELRRTLTEHGAFVGIDHL